MIQPHPGEARHTMPAKKAAAKKARQLPAKKFFETVEAYEQTTGGRTPARARAALLAGPVEVAGYTVHPASLNSQILLEEIDHPILRAAQAGSPEAAAAVPITSRDILNLLFIFTKPEEAWRTMGMSKENFLASARDFGFTVSPAAIQPLVNAIRDTLFTASRTIPGGDQEGGDEETGEAHDPLAPSRPQRPG